MSYLITDFETLADIEDVISNSDGSDYEGLTIPDDINVDYNEDIHENIDD